MGGGPGPHRDRPTDRRPPPGVRPVVGHARALDARRHARERVRPSHGVDRPRAVLRAGRAARCYAAKPSSRTVRRARVGARRRLGRGRGASRGCRAGRLAERRQPPLRGPGSRCPGGAPPQSLLHPLGRDVRSSRFAPCRTRSCRRACRPDARRHATAPVATGSHTPDRARGRIPPSPPTSSIGRAPYLDSDAVFAVKPSLLRDFVPRPGDDPELPAGVDGPWFSVRNDIVLAPAEDLHAEPAPGD